MMMMMTMMVNEMRIKQIAWPNSVYFACGCGLGYKKGYPMGSWTPVTISPLTHPTPNDPIPRTGNRKLKKYIWAPPGVSRGRAVTALHVVLFWLDKLEIHSPHSPHRGAWNWKLLSSQWSSWDDFISMAPNKGGKERKKALFSREVRMATFANSCLIIPSST